MICLALGEKWGALGVQGLPAIGVAAAAKPAIPRPAPNCFRASRRVNGKKPGLIDIVELSRTEQSLRVLLPGRHLSGRRRPSFVLRVRSTVSAAARRGSRGRARLRFRFGRAGVGAIEPSLRLLQEL